MVVFRLNGQKKYSHPRLLLPVYRLLSLVSKSHLPSPDFRHLIPSPVFHLPSLVSRQVGHNSLEYCNN